MRIFFWRAYADDGKSIADGYLLAENRKVAEKKLEKVPYSKHAKVKLEEGYVLDAEFDIYGVAIR